jgi:sulfur-carrier protein
VARVVFTKNLQRHVPCPPTTAPGRTVREVLDTVFAENTRLRGYVVDERGSLRKHMTIFVDGQILLDRRSLSDEVGPDSEIYVMQALSGG